MTGHGRGIANANGVRVVVECASVNRKSAEVVFAASRDYLAFEPRVREEVLGSVSRGRVTVNMNIAIDEAKTIHIDHKAAKAYYKELVALQKVLGLTAEIPLRVILAGPCVKSDLMHEPDKLWPTVKKALRTALDALLAMRAKEGRHLKSVLKREMINISRATKGIALHADRLKDRYRQTLQERLCSAGLQRELADPHVSAEIALFAERCDITEELDRIASHVEQFLEKLTASGPIGRTLEFILQEMMREWNTVGSKSCDISVSRFVIEAKTSLDRIREQLANIE